MPYIQRLIKIEVEFNISTGNEALQDKEQFANWLKEFIDNWLMISNTKVLKVKDFLHDEERN